MFVRVVLFAIAALAFVVSNVSGVFAQENASPAQTVPIDVNTEERAIADLDGSGDAFVLSASQPVSQVRFVLPPHTVSTEAWLRLAARPSSESTTGRIQVTVNDGEPIVIRPQARPMEARFALFSADLQPGENILEIRYMTETAAPGWIVDARRSQLRLTLEPVRPIASLDDLELALAADFAAPRRIALDTEPGRERITLEALVAQGLALRAGEVPLFMGDNENADLIVRIAEHTRLGEADRAALRQGGAQGSEIAFRHDGTPRLIVAGRNLDEATAAARLLGARSLAGHGTTFLAADAIRAERLGRRQVRDARDQVRTDASLRDFAASGRPFSTDQGARTAVQFSTRGDADRYGALSVLARASLISGEAWLYAWYGDVGEAAPADHNLLIIGPNSSSVADIDRNAPEELHAALRAAERSRGQRGLMRLAAAAYADAGDHAAAPGEANGTGVGVAALFPDRRTPTRWIGTLTTPQSASFADAGRSLARSDLWASLEGRAAVWSSRGVTPLDFSVAAPSLAERAQEFAIDHTRDAAFLLCGAALLMLIRGFASRRQRRRAHA